MLFQLSSFLKCASSFCSSTSWLQRSFFTAVTYCCLPIQSEIEWCFQAWRFGRFRGSTRGISDFFSRLYSTTLWDCFAAFNYGSIMTGSCHGRDGLVSWTSQSHSWHSSSVGFSFAAIRLIRQRKSLLNLGARESYSFWLHKTYRELWHLPNLSRLGCPRLCLYSGRLKTWAPKTDPSSQLNWLLSAYWSKLPFRWFRKLMSHYSLHRPIATAAVSLVFAFLMRCF